MPLRLRRNAISLGLVASLQACVPLFTINNTAVATGGSVVASNTVTAVVAGPTLAPTPPASSSTAQPPSTPTASASNTPAPTASVTGAPSPVPTAIATAAFQLIGGMVTTVAGDGKVAGYNDGQGDQATFDTPLGIAVDSHGTIFVADQYNACVRKVTPSGAVSLFAGSKLRGFANGFGAAARFNNLADIAIDSHDNLFVADPANAMIRKITPSGEVSTFAGGGRLGNYEGNGTDVDLQLPSGMTVDTHDNLFVVSGSDTILKISPSADVEIYLRGGGGFRAAPDGSTGDGTYLFNPCDVAAGPDGSIYIAHGAGNEILRISPAKVLTSFVGFQTAGFKDGSQKVARFDHPSSLVIDKQGVMYVADYGNGRIRCVTPDGNVSTIAGGAAKAVDGIGKAAGFANPFALALDGNGGLFVMDLGDEKSLNLGILPTGFGGRIRHVR